MVLTFPTIIAVVDNTPHITDETAEEYTILSNIWFNFVIQDLLFLYIASYVFKFSAELLLSKIYEIRMHSYALDIFTIIT